MQFDWTVSVGDVIQVGVLVLAIFIAYHKLILRIARIEWYLSRVWNKVYPDDKIELTDH